MIICSAFVLRMGRHLDDPEVTFDAIDVALRECNWLVGPEVTRVRLKETQCNVTRYNKSNPSASGSRTPFLRSVRSTASIRERERARARVVTAADQFQPTPKLESK